MNHKPLFIASLAATILAAMALEGNALSLGQAVVVLVPAGVLMVWSFMQTDWWEGVRKTADKHKMTQKKPQQSSNSSKGQ